MSTFRRAFLALVLVVTPSIVGAQTRTPAVLNLGDWSVSPILMVNNPNGSGTAFNYCYINETHARTSSNITVSVTYADNSGPILHLSEPAWNLVFYNITGSLFYCPNQAASDTVTMVPPIFENYNSTDGVYHITKYLKAGGSGSASVKLVWNGTPKVVCELGTMYFISTDLNADGHTNLSDTPLFTSLYYSGTYQKAIDFQYDGAINLSDISYYGSRVGTACP